MQIWIPPFKKMGNGIRKLWTNLLHKHTHKMMMHFCEQCAREVGVLDTNEQIQAWTRWKMNR